MSSSTPSDPGLPDPIAAVLLDAPVMIFATDRNGRLTHVSRTLATWLGHAPEVMIGRALSDFVAGAPGAPLQTAGHLRTHPVLLKATGGALKPAEISRTMPVDGHAGDVPVLGLVSEGARTATNANLAEENRGMSRFLAAMSHEIRTPMNAIMGFAQLLRRSNLNSKQLAQVDAIISGGNTLLRLLSDLLDLSRFESGRLRAIREPFDLRRMVDEVMDMWHSGAFEKGLRLRCVMDPDVPVRVNADVGRVRQVLNNFLSNAIKFTEEGEVTLTVRQAVRSGIRSTLVFEVRDTGPGLSPDAEERLFVPFVQVDTGLAHKHAGWGLGLSICQHIASVLKATLNCRTNEDGVGATFSLTLPVDVVPVLAADPPIEDTTTEGPALNVLLAEDNLLNQDAVVNMLSELGHRVTAVSNGYEAVAMLHDKTFDVVLMDISMPGLDGIGATEQIRALAGPQRSVPIIAVTGNVNGGARALYQSMGMNDYIPKPVTFEALSQALNRVTTPDEADAA